MCMLNSVSEFIDCILAEQPTYILLTLYALLIPVLSGIRRTLSNRRMMMYEMI
jgi:hypothetical protein